MNYLKPYKSYQLLLFIATTANDTFIICLIIPSLGLFISVESQLDESVHANVQTFITFICRQEPPPAFLNVQKFLRE